MARKYDRAKSLWSQLYDIIDDFTDKKTGHLRSSNPDNDITLYGEIINLMNKALKAGDIYDFRTYQGGIYIDDVDCTAGYVAVSWMEQELKMYVFQWEDA